MPRFAGDCLDGHDALFDLRHLVFEKALDEPGRRAGDDDLRAPARVLDALDVYFQLLVQLVFFPGDLILRHQHALDLPRPDLHVDGLVLDPADDGGQKFALLVLVLVHRVRALDLPELLHDDLFRRLRGDAAEILGDDLLAQNVACLQPGLDVLRLFDGKLAFGVGHLFHDFAHGEDADGLLFHIRLHLDAALLPRVLFIGEYERVFQRVQKRLLRDALFPLQIFERQKEILVDHVFSFPVCVDSRMFIQNESPC